MTKVIDTEAIMSDPVKAGQLISKIIALGAMTSEKCDALAKICSALTEAMIEQDETNAELNRRLLALEAK